jgi:hypothetical protein
LLQGTGRALEIIPVVLQTIKDVKSTEKSVIREELRKRFRPLVYIPDRRRNDPKYVRARLDETWLDQYSLPMCERLRLIDRNRGYHLTSYGERLLLALKKGYFKDQLCRFLVEQDRSQWQILVTMAESPDMTADDLQTKLELKGIVINQHFHLVNLLRLFEVVDVVREQEQRYSVNMARYRAAGGQSDYRSYDEVTHAEFVDALEKSIVAYGLGKSQFVRIEDLRTPTSQRLKWPEEYFDKRLHEVPLCVGKHQLLLSPSPKAQKGGIIRNGRYYTYLTLY